MHPILYNFVSFFGFELHENLFIGVCKYQLGTCINENQ